MFKYLHRTNDLALWLDHRVHPEVRAMLVAMNSRMPEGGIEAKYQQVIDTMNIREDDLAELNASDLVKPFMDLYVHKYNHSSIKEQTGSPVVFIENINWFTAWQLFDTPLVIGQELSTRAISRPYWPMALDIPKELLPIHEAWFTLFTQEVEFWKLKFRDPEERKKYGFSDAEQFRPAFDMARWALPGTISTSASYTSHIRDRQVALKKALLPYYGAPNPYPEIAQAYREASPSMFSFQEPISREVFRPSFFYGSKSTSICANSKVTPIPQTTWQDPPLNGISSKLSTYLPERFANISHSIEFPTSIAAARDWHRHRTMGPPKLEAVTDQIFPFYKPMTVSKDKLNDMMWTSVEAYQKYGITAMPFGTQVILSATVDERSLAYILALRGKKENTNPEYRAMSRLLLEALPEQIKGYFKKD